MLRLSSRSVALCLLVLLAPAAAHAAVPVLFGQSWDGPNASIQNIINQTYGVGTYTVNGTNYIGAQTPDPDPFYWVDGGFSALVIKEIAGNANRNVVGWYLETLDGEKPVIDGIDDGVVFNGPASEGFSTVIRFNRPGRCFGFYLDPNGPGDAINAPQPERFFTNRFFNDLGPDGHGAIHVPYDGDVQALIYDISSLTQPNTWLVCFEDLDSGANPGPCCQTTDNDFNDFIFEVHAIGVTPTQPITFGALKVKYR